MEHNSDESISKHHATVITFASMYSTMTKLKAAVEQMDATRTTADPVRALRHWRLAAERRYMSVVVKAAEIKPAKKGRSK
jgi:hypothetical protein